MKAWQLLPYFIGFIIGGAFSWFTPSRGPTTGNRFTFDSFIEDARAAWDAPPEEA